MANVKHIQRVYYLIIGLFWLATALPLPLLVLFHQYRGLDLFQIGILMGAYSLTIVLLEVPTGGLADAVGRKRVTQLAYAISLAAGLVFLFAFAFPAFLLAWILSGVARALASGALDAWFVDSLQAADPEIDIQAPLARAGTVALLALGAGTLIGGALPTLFKGLPAEGQAVITPFAITLLLAACLNVLLLLAVTLLVKERRPQNAEAGWTAGFGQVPAIMREAVGLSRKNSILQMLMALTLVSGLALASVETFWQPRFAGLINGAESRSYLFGAIMAGSFLIGAAGNILSIPLTRRFGGRYALVAAGAQGAQGAALLLLASQATLIPSALLFWLVYLSMGVHNSPQATLVNQQIPAERRSAMLSLQSLAGYTGGILGSVALGYVAQTTSIAAAWLIAGSLLLVSLILYLRIDILQSRGKKQHDSETAILETT